MVTLIRTWVTRVGYLRVFHCVGTRIHPAVEDAFGCYEGTSGLTITHLCEYDHGLARIKAGHAIIDHLSRTWSIRRPPVHHASDQDSPSSVAFDSAFLVRTYNLVQCYRYNNYVIIYTILDKYMYYT
jgi:hypothetical protein